MNLLEQFARHLQFLGHGIVSDEEQEGDIFWAVMPDKPDDCICVFSADSQYGGSLDGARLQVITRGMTAKAAYERSQAIVDSLVDEHSFLAGDGADAQIEVINASVGLGADENQRQLFSSNFRVKYCNF